MAASKNKVGWRELGLLLLSVALTLGLAEAFFRSFVWVERGTPYVEENRDTIYFSKRSITGRHTSPGEFDYIFHTNSRGLRSPEIQYERNSKPRILCLGDSFTFGIGASDDRSWPAMVAQQFASEGTPVEVVNGGVMGWGLAEYLIWLEREGRRYNPDLIVIGVHAGDWENASNGLITVNEENELEKHPVIRKDVRRLKAVADWIPLYPLLMTNSALANYLKQIVVQRTEQGTNKKSAGGPSFAATRRLNELIVRDLRARSREIPADLLFIFIPTYQQVLGQNRDSGYDEFRKMTLQSAEEANIPIIDLVPILQKTLATGQATITDYYHLRDGHNTARGYELIAKSLMVYLGQHRETFAKFQRARKMGS